MEVNFTANGFELSGNVVQEETEKLIEAFKEILASANDSLEIDMKEVEELDVSALQIMIAAAKSADKAQKKIRFVSPSNSVRGTLELAGLEGMFEASQ